MKYLLPIICLFSDVGLFILGNILLWCPESFSLEFIIMLIGILLVITSAFRILLLIKNIRWLTD